MIHPIYGPGAHATALVSIWQSESPPGWIERGLRIFKDRITEPVFDQIVADLSRFERKRQLGALSSPEVETGLTAILSCDRPLRSLIFGHPIQSLVASAVLYQSVHFSSTTTVPLALGSLLDCATRRQTTEVIATQMFLLWLQQHCARSEAGVLLTLGSAMLSLVVADRAAVDSRVDAAAIAYRRRLNGHGDHNLSLRIFVDEKWEHRWRSCLKVDKIQRAFEQILRRSEPVDGGPLEIT